MKYSPLLFHLIAAALISSASRAQMSALVDRPYQPSASVIKGTVAALSDSSDEVALLAVRALADWRQASAADAVAKLLGPGTTEGVRLEAFQFFSRLGPEAKPHLAEVIKHLGDASPNIRVAVLAVILQAEASAENADKIRALLDDSRSDVRAAAAKCLGQAGKAAEAHRKPLLTAISNGGGPEFKAEALRALTRIGGLSVEDIDAITPLLRDGDAEVRVAAWAAILSGIVEAKKTGAIPEQKDKALHDALLAQFEAEPVEIKAVIIQDAGKDKGTAEASVERLAKQIRTGTIEVKSAALRVLGDAGSAALGQLPLIVQQAGDPDSAVRAAAIAALGSLGPAAVRPNVALLAKALMDDSDLVRDEALQALPAAGDAMRNFPYKVRDVYPTASPAVRATLVKALPIAVRVLGMDDDAIARGRAALTDASPEIRIGMAYVMGQLGSPLGDPLVPELLVLLKDPEPTVRGAAAIPLRVFAKDDAAKQKFREALQPLLKDRESPVRWAALDTLHDLDPGKGGALVAEIAALLKDQEATVRSAAVRTLGAAGAVAKPYLVDVIRFFLDDPATPPYAAAEAVAQISPLSAQELTSLLYPLYVYPDLQPLVRLTAYSASGGERDGLLIARLLGRNRMSIGEIVTPDEKVRADALLQEALKAPLLHEKLKAEITQRLAELKAVR